MAKFLRRTWNRYSKLGKGRKKKQVWRRPTGRDNKMREKRKGVPVVVSIGYKQGEKKKGLVNGKKPVLVMNVKDLEKIGKNEIVVIGNIGLKKKIELANKAKEMKVHVHNLNVKSFLKKVEKRKIQKEKAKKELEEKKTKKEKKKIKKESKKDSSTKKEIVKDIKESGVSEKVAKKEEALDEKAQAEEKK